MKNIIATKTEYYKGYIITTEFISNTSGPKNKPPKFHKVNVFHNKPGEFPDMGKMNYIPIEADKEEITKTICYTIDTVKGIVDEIIKVEKEGDFLVDAGFLVRDI